MNNINTNKFLLIILSLFIFTSLSYAEVVKKITINGNERISNETIIVFSSIKIGDNITSDKINEIVDNLYTTNFFENISVNFENQELIIQIKESPIINKIEFKGLKSKTLIESLRKNLKLKSRSSYNEYLIETDRFQIISELKTRGYYYSTIEIFKELKENNSIDLIYQIDLGQKAKIKKITFNGNKIYKDSKLKSVIISEEYKFWKFISGKKYLNESTIQFDLKLLKNFYLNEGYYDVRINSSFAKLVDDKKFELIYNINANNKYFFNKIELKLPDDFSSDNFSEIYKLFNNLEGKPYSINRIDNILSSLDKISTNEQFESVKSIVEENIDEDKINLKFIIQETKKVFVQKINILGNNITRESVLRNQLEVDEGDPYNEILLTKSINNLKSLNFFKSVNYNVRDSKVSEEKIIDIEIEEKATGEIMAGAGFGTGGNSITAGVKENNYLGQGIALNTNFTLTDDTIRGIFSLTNPNYNNTDKAVYTSIESSEIDKLSDFGYKTNKTGISFGTKFELYDDFKLGLGMNSFYEEIEVDSSASTLQKQQKGNYFDNFLNLELDYDKRDQKFQTTEGFRSFYGSNIPLISDSNTFTNLLTFTKYSQFLNKNIFKSSFYFKSSNSITGDNIKLSERITIPSKRLRGFETGKVGPKDGTDFIGGNFVSAANFSSSLPQIFENSQTTDFSLFLDIANVWGVDYNSALDKSQDIRSSIGINLDWFSAVGPLSFSLSQPITKSSTDKTQSFRFNLGTTF